MYVMFAQTQNWNSIDWHCHKVCFRVHKVNTFFFVILKPIRKYNESNHNSRQMMMKIEKKNTIAVGLILLNNERLIAVQLNKSSLS